MIIEIIIKVVVVIIMIYTILRGGKIRKRKLPPNVKLNFKFYFTWRKQGLRL